MSRLHWDIEGLLKWWQDTWSSSRTSSGDCLLLRCDGNTGIPSTKKQGNASSSQDDEGELELFFSFGGSLMFLSRADGLSWKFLSCLKSVKYSFLAQDGRWDFS